jgi:hypothetical protein
VESGLGAVTLDEFLVCGCFLPQWRFVKPGSALLLPLDIYFEEYLVGEGRAGGRVGSHPWICNLLMHVKGAPAPSSPRWVLGEASDCSRWWRLANGADGYSCLAMLDRFH